MTGAGPLLELRAIHKAFPGVHALTGVDLDIRRGETHALLGENGAGKSTLIKILSGVFPPDGGTILFRGKAVHFDNPVDSQKAGIRVIYQESHLVRHLTVAENICLGAEPHLPSGLPIIDRDRMTDDAQALLDRLNLAIDPLALVEDLSAAEQRMIEAARALHHAADLIILDEPTASLSARETADLFSVLRTLHAQGVTLLFISHRLEEVLRLADRATILRDGRKIVTVPLAETTPEELIQWIVGRYLPGVEARTPAVLGPEILQVKHLRRAGVLEDISFTLRAGEVLGITGLLGAGGTALTNALFGAEPAESGTVCLDGQCVQIRSPEDAIALGIGMLPEDRLRQGLVLEMRAQHNMTLVALENAWPGPFIDHRFEHEIAEHFAGQLGIRRESLAQPAMTLSGGTQQKVVLSKWLAAHARVLIFDEPTRGVDVGARVEIYRLMGDLARRGTGILLIASDPAEILSMCDRILVMRHGVVVADLPRAEATRAKILLLASGGVPS